MQNKDGAAPVAGGQSDLPLGHAFRGLRTDDKCQEWVRHGDIGCKRRCDYPRASHECGFGRPAMAPQPPDPLRTRDNYNFRCQRCAAPHNLDTVIPSAAWNVIVERDSPGGDKYGALCTLCIDELLVTHGLTDVECRFYFVGKGMRSRLYEDEACK